MASGEYVPPQLDSKGFHCPHCGAFAHQDWSPLYFYPSGGSDVEGWRASHCHHCHKRAIWIDGSMVFPSGGTAPLPNPDLPDDIKRDYEEARAILTRSPRGAAALLRLAIQKLCKVLGEPGKDIYRDIAALVRKGLSPQIQKALDTVRVIGNDAVHPGMIDLRDDPALAGMLFKLVNLITERMITEPRAIDDLYAGLPESKLDAIARRDGKD